MRVLILILFIYSNGILAQKPIKVIKAPKGEIIFFESNNQLLNIKGFKKIIQNYPEAKKKLKGYSFLKISSISGIVLSSYYTLANPAISYAVDLPIDKKMLTNSLLSLGASISLNRFNEKRIQKAVDAYNLEIRTNKILEE